MQEAKEAFSYIWNVSKWLIKPCGKAYVPRRQILTKVVAKSVTNSKELCLFKNISHFSCGDK